MSATESGDKRKLDGQLAQGLNGSDLVSWATEGTGHFSMATHYHG
jgi:hypothetical protein